MTEQPLAISRKLGIKAGHRVVFVHTPLDFALADLPPGVEVEHRDVPPDPPADVIVAFFVALSDLEGEVADLASSITVAGALWVAWPRRAGGGRSDLTDNLVRGLGLSGGLVDVKVAALEERWSSLRFVRRLADRKAPEGR